MLSKFRLLTLSDLVPFSMKTPSACDSLPPKLDRVLRRLVWLRAPRAPQLNTGSICFPQPTLHASLFPMFPSQTLLKLPVCLFHESTQAFILLILLVGNLTIVDMENPASHYEVLEYYAGTARLARLGKAMGINVAAMDSLYDVAGDNRKKNNSHDLNTSAGMVSLYQIL